MSIDSVSSTHSSHRPHFHQIRQDLSALQSDLQSGNVAQAQTDFASLLSDAPRLKNALSAASSAPATGSDAMSSSAVTSLGALSTALQSGDVSGASAALTSLQQNLGGPVAQGLPHHHHHHHHGGSGGVSAPVQNDMQSLASALQSGDIAGAQAAFAQLQSDDPALATVGNAGGNNTVSSV